MMLEHGTLLELLLVTLDDRRISRSSSLLIKPGVTEGAPLTQEIPTLVERDLELAQALPIGVVGRPS
jgi:hypothetical protein